MQLENKMVTAWQRQAGWLWLLYPLTLLYMAVSKLRRQAYRVGMLSVYHAPVPVLVVGNITVGGSGKTPLLIALVNYLHKHNIKVGVISRGYGRSTSDTRLVVMNSQPQEVGDEPLLIVQQTGAPMAVGADRKAAIKLLLQQHPSIELILSDDGLQHYALGRDIEWVVIDADRGFGNQQQLPTGYLREPLSRLRNTTNLLHVSADTKIVATHIARSLPATAATIGIMTLQPKSLIGVNLTEKQDDDVNVPKAGETVYAVTGIGYPPRFFASLRRLGYKLIECPFADHHHYRMEDISQLTQYPIITTSKDAVKLATLGRPFWVLAVDAALDASVYDKLNQQLQAVGIYLNS